MSRQHWGPQKFFGGPQFGHAIGQMVQYKSAGTKEAHTMLVKLAFRVLPWVTKEMLQISVRLIKKVILGGEERGNAKAK